MVNGVVPFRKTGKWLALVDSRMLGLYPTEGEAGAARMEYLAAWSGRAVTKADGAGMDVEITSPA